MKEYLVVQTITYLVEADSKENAIENIKCEQYTKINDMQHFAEVKEE